MNRADFVEQNEATWREFEAMIQRIESRDPPANLDQLPRFFRAVCRDLATAQHRMYGIPLIDRLNGLVSRGYKHLYREPGLSPERIGRFFAADLPQTVRRQWRLFWLCNAVYWLPLIALIFAGKFAPEWITAILGPGTMASLDASWGSGDLDRGFFGDLQMFGMYIYNNVRIDFMVFAGGLFLGVGTLFLLFFNGIQHGAVAGYMNMAGYNEKFYSFVSGHSSYELLGMILAAMAGMILGLAILRPGRHLRGEALKKTRDTTLTLILGAAFLTIFAACVEGFWSANNLPPRLKYSVGIAGWILLGCYFLFAGRGRGPAGPTTAAGALAASKGGQP